jgi:hypothetical protein
MDKNISLWNRNSPLQEIYEKLWTELVPERGPSITREGELLRAIGRIYYHGNLHRFGVECLKDEWDVVESQKKIILNFLTEPDYIRFKNNFKATNFGENRVTNKWNLNNDLETLSIAEVHSVNFMQANKAHIEYHSVSELISALNSKDWRERKDAAHYADTLIQDGPGWLDDDVVKKIARASLIILMHPTENIDSDFVKNGERKHNHRLTIPSPSPHHTKKTNEHE